MQTNIIFTQHPLTGQVIGLVYGQAGYLSVVTDVTAECLNSLYTGATQEVVESYLAGSMFGWNTPAAEEARRFHNAMLRIANKEVNIL